MGGDSPVQLIRTAPLQPFEILEELARDASGSGLLISLELFIRMLKKTANTPALSLKSDCRPRRIYLAKQQIDKVNDVG